MRPGQKVSIVNGGFGAYCASGKVGYVVDNDLFAEVEQVSYKGLPECVPHIKVWVEDGRTIYRANPFKHGGTLVKLEDEFSGHAQDRRAVYDRPDVSAIMFKAGYEWLGNLRPDYAFELAEQTYEKTGKELVIKVAYNTFGEIVPNKLGIWVFKDDKKPKNTKFHYNCRCKTEPSSHMVMRQRQAKKLKNAVRAKVKDKSE
jgi:uncharacterized protein YktA (UPF0223 family)